MSAHDLIRELEALPQDEGIHWRKLYDRIMEAAQRPNTEEERLILLSLFQKVLDGGEAEMAEMEPASLEEFRGWRLSSYRLLLVTEASSYSPDGGLTPSVMARIAKREVDAGRMGVNDDLYQLAIAGNKLLGEPGPMERGGAALGKWVGRLFRRK